HHRVADELLDGAAVDLDQPAAAVEVAREQLTHVLGVAPLRQRREPDQVGEEDRDEAPFRSRRGDRRRWGSGRRSKRRAALAAEGVTGIERRATGRTADGERGPTGGAELAALAIGRTAVRTDGHRRPDTNRITRTS